MGINSVDVAYLVGVLTGAVLFGGLLFAVGFDKGRKVSWKRRPGGVNLSQELLADLIGKRMNELVASAKARAKLPPHRVAHLRAEDLMTLPELQEYHRLQSQWQILRDERTSCAVSRLIKEAELSVAHGAHP